MHTLTLITLALHIKINNPRYFCLNYQYKPNCRRKRKTSTECLALPSRGENGNLATRKLFQQMTD